MTKLLMACALTNFALTCASATELAPGSGHSIHLAAFDGIVYYTVERGGFRVVATLASGGADALPIRVISTLASGENLVISVPRSAREPSIDFEILRNGDAIVINDVVPAAVVNDVSEKVPSARGR